MVSFETIRFPLLFGGFLAAALTTYAFRERLLPDFEAERQKIFRGSAEDQQAIKDAIRELSHRRTSQ